MTERRPASRGAPKPEAVRAALTRAADYVLGAGGELTGLRLQALLGERPAGDVASVLAREGGAGCGLRGAHRVISILDDLLALDGALIENAVATVSGCQQADGSWETAEAWHPAAAGEEPDPVRDEPDHVFATGMLAGHLAKTRCVRPEVLEAAGSYLGGHFTPDRVGGFAWPAVVGFAHFFAIFPHDLSDPALQWCGRELERGYRMGRFDACQTSRVFVLTRARALPGARVRSDELVASLLNEQDGEGAWGSLGGSTEARVETTLEAVTALRRLADL